MSEAPSTRSTWCGPAVGVVPIDLATPHRRRRRVAHRAGHHHGGSHHGGRHHRRTSHHDGGSHHGCAIGGGGGADGAAGAVADGAVAGSAVHRGGAEARMHGCLAVCAYGTAGTWARFPRAHYTINEPAEWPTHGSRASQITATGQPSRSLEPAAAPVAATRCARRQSLRAEEPLPSRLSED